MLHRVGAPIKPMKSFWSLLYEKTAEVPSKGVIVVAGDLNEHVDGKKGCYSCHSGFGYGSPKTLVYTCAVTRRRTMIAIDIDFSRCPVDIYPDHGAAPRSGRSINRANTRSTLPPTSPTAASTKYTIGLRFMRVDRLLCVVLVPHCKVNKYDLLSIPPHVSLIRASR